MKTQTHTPTPWIAEGYAGGPYEIWPAPGNARLTRIARTQDVTPEDQANAAFIVRACNSHDALLAALEHCAQKLEDEDIRNGLADMTSAELEEAHDTIAKAKGETK